jgi:hypothetical protein
MREPFSKFAKSELSQETLMITSGLPGTWKTETSEEVSKIKGFPILRSDLIRLEVLKGEDVFDAKVAGNMNKRLSVYDEMFKRADALLSKERKGLIMDATFVTQELRKRAAEIAAKHKMELAILETKCSEQASVNRIQKRTKEEYVSNALTVEAYLANKNKFEPIDVDALKKSVSGLKILHFVVDTEHDEPENWHIVQSERR